MGVLHTLRGTRPGSPLADIGLNLMMTDLLKELQAALMEEEDFRQGAEAPGYIRATNCLDG